MPKDQVTEQVTGEVTGEVQKFLKILHTPNRFKYRTFEALHFDFGSVVVDDRYPEENEIMQVILVLNSNNNGFNICLVATGGNLKFGDIGSQGETKIVIIITFYVPILWYLSQYRQIRLTSVLFYEMITT